MAVLSIAAVLLAAGASRRFGGDKLLAEIDGEAVIRRSARAIAEAGFTRRAVVVASSAPGAIDDLDFDVVANARADGGLATSISAGVVWAREMRAEAILIALGDMPFVSSGHYARLVGAFGRSSDHLAFSACGNRRTPPALFGEVWFERLLTLKGDQGARDILAEASAADGIEASPAELADIDTRADLRTARK